MWTAENRPRYNRDRPRYPSDLTDEEWGLLEPLIPPAKRADARPDVMPAPMSCGNNWKESRRE